jgi:hypothetical protein
MPGLAGNRFWLCAGFPLQSSLSLFSLLQFATNVRSELQANTHYRKGNSWLDRGSVKVLAKITETMGSVNG